MKNRLKKVASSKKFVARLEKMIDCCMELSKEWEELENEEFESANNGYPFEKDFQEVINDLIKWKEKVGEVE